MPSRNSVRNYGWARSWVLPDLDENELRGDKGVVTNEVEGQPPVLLKSRGAQLAAGSCA